LVSKISPVGFGWARKAPRKGFVFPETVNGKVMDTSTEPTPEEIRCAISREKRFRAKAKAKEAQVAPVLARVINGVWHTTSTTRFQGILASGAILPEPPIKDKDRWSTSRGKDYYPYVRTLGGVS
jgi:hypothetical protein